jgi:hypothetical protein
MERISVEAAYFLMMRYPPLANYIQEAYNRGDHEELLDFLFALETEPVLRLN